MVDAANIGNNAIVDNMNVRCFNAARPPPAFRMTVRDPALPLMPSGTPPTRGAVPGLRRVLVANRGEIAVRIVRA
ncbi:MAG: hypothetical protein MUC32_10425, partial [Burkholderiaceae bacterium]|nr:hypothetical protein [Burkholderiaceae bacterium]